MTAPPPGSRPQTLAAQGFAAPRSPFGEVVPPVYVSTTYERAGDGSYPGGRVYSRDHNPGYDAPEALLAALEGGAAAMLFSSGMAASSAVLQVLAPGERVVAPRAMYWGWRNQLCQVCARWQLPLAWYANGDAADLEARLAEAPTRLLWVETPANPTWEVTDLAHAADAGHRHGALVVVDSTCASPVLTRPLAFGADLVMHSATKYLNGHSDVVAGALVTRARDATWEALQRVRGQGGAVPGPFEAWLLQRGMRTLFPRVQAACRNALALAGWLEAHPQVVAVAYPGLPSHPGHAVACRQMEGGFGGMLSVRVAGGAAGAQAVAARLRVFRRATSLGSTESLVEHRQSVEGPGSLCPPDLLRLSVGIEAIEDLIGDFAQALEAAP